MLARPMLRCDLRSRLHHAAQRGDSDRLLAAYRDALRVAPGPARAYLYDLGEDCGAAALLYECLYPLDRKGGAR